MDETVKLIADLVGTVGVPGAVLILGIWKLAPVATRIVETLAEVKDTLREMKDEMRTLNDRMARAV